MAAPRKKISRTGLALALTGLVCQHFSVHRIAEGLGVSWNTANEAVLAEGQRLRISDRARFDGVKKFSALTSMSGVIPAPGTST